VNPVEWEISINYYSYASGDWFGSPLVF